MATIHFKHKGNFSKTTRFLQRVPRVVRMSVLHAYAEKGVRALEASTPVESGKTARSWKYEIVDKNGRTVINFINTNVQDGVPIAIIIQYGHGTNNGGWVEGRDYINPAIQPIFDEITNDIWREVTNL